MSSRSSASALVRPLLDRWQAHPQQFALVTSSVATVSLALFWLARDYQRWTAMGPGGAPTTVLGYLAVLGLEVTRARRDTVSPDVYDQPEAAPGWSDASAAERVAAAETRFLKDTLPRRKGPQSRAKRFVIPQRERNADDPLDADVREAHRAMLDQLAEANSDRVEWRQSVLEMRGPAVFLRPSIPVPTLAVRGQGEICHIHTSDLSGHVNLSFVDAKEVIAKGWGERHRLSGAMIQLGYTMVFVPRTVEEVEVFRAIFQAGIDYMCSSR